jgi:hypothetical protein
VGNYRSDEVRKALAELKEKHLVLSDESFSGKPLSFNYINRSLIAHRLKELFPYAKILIVIRNQEDIILSHYNQYVKMGGTKRIGELLYSPGKDFGLQQEEKPELKNLYYDTNDQFLHLDSFLYSGLLEMYTTLFEKIKLVLYEDIRNEPERTLCEIVDFMGVPFDNTSRYNALKRINQSLPHGKIPLLRQINKVRHLIGYNRLSRRISRVAVAFPSLIPDNLVKSRLRRIIAQKVDGHYRCDNAVLRKKYPQLGLERYSCYH